MNNKLKLVLIISILALISCNDCDDNTLQISDTLLDYIQYDSETLITMVNAQNETMDFTIIPGVDTQSEPDGDCITTSIKPFFTLNTPTQDEFMRIWASLNEDFLLGDNEQLWYIIDDVDGSILESGMIRDPLTMVSSVNLNGSTFDNAISISNSDLSTTATLYVQMDLGLIGYELMDETWVVE